MDSTDCSTESTTPRQGPDAVIDGLKELSALGMKIDTKYGGLGLTPVHYNKALALAGSANPAIGVLAAARQAAAGYPVPCSAS